MMTSTPLPEGMDRERVEDWKIESEDESWIKVGWKEGHPINEIPIEEHTQIDGSSTSYNNDHDNNEAGQVESSQDAKNLDKTDDTEETALVQSDESEDVSVITESEADQNIENQICDELHLQNMFCNALTTWRHQPNVYSMTRATVTTILVCSVGVLFGLAIPRLFSMTSTVCPLTSDTDLHTIKAENDKLVDHMKELIEVKSILNQIKATIPQTIEEQTEKVSFKKEHIKKPVTKDNFDSGPTILKHLQISLNAISGALSQVNNVNDLYKESITDSQNIIADLIDIQRIMTELAKQMKNLDRPVEAMFWEIANDNIINVSQSLLRRLSNTLLDLTVDINRKLNKMRCNLNKKICYLRNTLVENEQVFAQMEGSSKFIEQCDTIVNMKCKSLRDLKGKKFFKKKDPEIKEEVQKVIVDVDENKSKNVPVNSGKQEFVSKKYSGDTLLPRVNDFRKLLAEPFVARNTCPMFQEPFTYAEVVAGKHFAVLEESKENKSNSKNSSHVSKNSPLVAEEVFTNLPNIINDKDRGNVQHNDERKNVDIEQTNSQLNTQFTVKKVLDDPDPKLKTSNLPKKLKKNVNMKESDTDSSASRSKEDNPKLKKKKRSYPEAKVDKQAKDRANKNMKNSNKDRYKSKDYNRNRSSSFKDFRTNGNAEWQFKRSHAREELRLSHKVLDGLLDATNWYLDWSRARKDARKRKEEHDYDADDEDNSGDMFWRGSRDQKFQKHGRRTKESVRASHRENILQKRRG